MATAHVNTLQYPANLGTEEAVIPSWIQFTLFNRETLKVSPPVTMINLYMPEEMSQPSTVSWGSMSRRDEAINIASSIIGAGTSIWSKTATQAQKDVHGENMKKFNMAKDLASSATKMAGWSTGMITNPYLTAIFEGVGFREFQFRFKFTPHSEEDCDTIDSIIKRFREAALPDQTLGGLVFTYPMEIGIECKFNSDQNMWLQSFKRSVITSIDVAYGIGAQWSTFRNGFPTVVVLSLRFKEIQIIVRDDISKGF
jgi:hypothetical protein